MKNTMKKVLLPLCIFVLSAGVFSSCDKDDDKNNDVTIVTTSPRRITHMDNYKGNTVNYVFDTKGRIQSLAGQYVYGGDGMEEYDYSNLTVKGKYANSDIEGILNTDGTVAKVEGGNQVMTFTYDENGHVTYTNQEQKLGNFNSRFTTVHLTWEDGNIISTDMASFTKDLTNPTTDNITDSEKFPTMTYKYTSEKFARPIENKGNLMPNFYFYSDYVSFICATGEAPKNLPVAIDRGTGTFEDINYVFDQNGFPTKISFGDVVINYAWK